MAHIDYTPSPQAVDTLPSNVELAEALAELGGRALKQIYARFLFYDRYVRYYDGQHRQVTSTERLRNAFGYIFHQFADNLCPAVVDALVDRLEFLEFEADGQTSVQQVALANQLWKDNRLYRIAGSIHQDCVKCGDSFIWVWHDPKNPRQPRFYPQKTTGFTCYYDEEEPNVIQWAAKTWRRYNGHWRLVIFTWEAIYHFVSREKSDTMPDKPTSYTPFPTIETGTNVVPNPYNRVPIFHFANNAPIGEYGCSELKDVLSLQDLLNKTIMDMAVAMEFVALPQRIATGIEMEIDPLTGQSVFPFKNGPEHVWTVSSEDAKFDQFPAADLTQFLKVQDTLRIEIARVSGTPLHHFMLNTGNVPSGEALKALEERLIKKAKDRQASFGDVWSDAMAFAIEIATGVNSVKLKTKWVDPAPTDAKELAEAVQKRKDIGISERQALRELGYTDAQIDDMDQEKRDEAQSTAEATLTAFDRGGPPGTIPGAGGADDEPLEATST